MPIQSVLIPRKKYTLTEAKKWIRDNNFKETFYGKKPDITEGFYRFRQLKPVEGSIYYTRTRPCGIQLIFMQNYKN